MGRKWLTVPVSGLPCSEHFGVHPRALAQDLPAGGSAVLLFVVEEVCLSVPPPGLAPAREFYRVGMASWLQVPTRV